MTKISKAGLLFSIALFLGWTFDFLFWNRGLGLNFPIYVVLLIGRGLWLARREGIKAEGKQLALIAGILFFAFIGLWRREPFGLFISMVLVLGMMGTLAVSFRKGLWPSYGLLDYIEKIGLMPFRGLRTYGAIKAKDKEGAGEKVGRKRFGSVLRGILLALPIVFILGSLLASADYFFAAWLDEVFAFLRIENLAELFWRTAIILILSYGLLGVYVFAINDSKDEKLLGEGKGLFAPFLGFQEAVIVLGSVIGLFAVFVGIQLRYFFGGVANINLKNFSYAEYARRGFGELVAVAVISVGLFVALSLMSQRQSSGEKKWFSGLGAGLFALVGVILISAYQRLLLYESIYGFTRTRTNAHVFMIWLGVFLLTLIVLEIIGKRRYFTLAFMLACVGFGTSITLLNVDGFIVHANAERLRKSGVMDVAYLVSLSVDAVPALIEEIGESSDVDANKLIAALGCQSYILDDYVMGDDWQAITFAQMAARSSWEEFQASSDVEITGTQYGEYKLMERISVGGESYDCWNFDYID